jgi:hypothetical protein
MHYRIASVSKTLMALGVLRLVQQERLSLRARLCRVVPKRFSSGRSQQSSASPRRAPAVALGTHPGAKPSGRAMRAESKFASQKAIGLGPLGNVLRALSRRKAEVRSAAPHERTLERVMLANPDGTADVQAVDYE